MKYIDADELRAKIYRLIKMETSESGNLWDEGFSTCGEEINDIIDSLQQEQPEVDVENEIEEHIIYMPHGEFSSDKEILEDMEWARKEFRHFYELGLNARKEESK